MANELSPLGSRRRRSAPGVALVALTLLAACSDDASPVESVAGTPTAKIAAFYHPPADAPGLSRLSTDASWITLTGDDSQMRDLMRRSGSPVPFYVYLLAMQTVPDHWDNNALWADVPDPANPQSAYFEDALATHPEWFLRDQYGQFVHDNAYMMDPANTGWQQFLAAQARTLLGPGKWDGLFLDNLMVTFKRPVRLASQNPTPPGATQGPPVPWDYAHDQPYTNESFGTAVQSMTQAVRDGATRPTGTVLWANLTDATTTYPDQRAKYLPYLDGWMDEGFASRYSTDEQQTPEQWERSMQTAELAIAARKPQVLVGQGERDNLALMRFTFASYLLVADEHTWFRYAHTSNYIEFWWYPLYDLDFGRPLAPRHQLLDGRWRRDYLHGYVVVDPDQHDVELVLNGRKV